MFDVDQLRRSMEALIRDYPDLEDDEVLRSDMLEGATNMIEVLDHLLHAASNDKVMIDAIDARVDELTERCERFRRRVEYFRALMLSIMQSGDLRKVVLPEATLVQAKSQPQIVGHIDADALPDDLVTVKRTPKRGAIHAALEQGRKLPGLSLGNAPPILQVRTR